MAAYKIAIWLAILCLYSRNTLCDVDPNLTVDNANNYIAENKDKVDPTYRLKYHSMPPTGWTNDPNGFIFFQGEYHLFYQFNPYNAYATKVHWGHMKSKDLVHWEDLPVALAPDHDYDAEGVWSGSAIEKDGKLYSMYAGNTGSRQVQCIAISEDGIRFEKVEQNPVLDESDLPSNARPQDFRDPKVFKRGDLYYVVTVSKTDEDTGQILLHQSEDLINWELKSTLLKGTREQGNMWECPDLFQLDGKDVLLLSGVNVPRTGDDFSNLDSVLVFIGEVDWEEGTFNVESMKEVDHGMDFYASQTTSDEQDRRLMTAWMNMWGRNYPTADMGHNWAGAMILPRELRIEDGALIQKPIKEIVDLFEQVAEFHNITLASEGNITHYYTFEGVSGKVGEMELQINLEEANSITIELRANADEETIITYETSTSEITLDRTNSGVVIKGAENPQVFSRKVIAPLKDNVLKLQVFLDTSSIEIFVNDGKETLTATIYPMMEPSDSIQFAVEGTAIIETLTFSEIRL